MELDVLMLESEREVLDEAYAALQRSAQAHYNAAGETFTRQWLTELFRLVVDAISTRNLGEISAYSEGVARERFEAGYDICEVQTAFNALEEAMWRRVVASEPPSELAESVGLLSTVLGFGKDAVARTYVSLASKRHVPTLDLSALFNGPNS